MQPRTDPPIHSLSRRVARWRTAAARARRSSRGADEAPTAPSARSTIAESRSESLSFAARKTSKLSSQRVCPRRAPGSARPGGRPRRAPKSSAPLSSRRGDLECPLAAGGIARTRARRGRLGARARRGCRRTCAHRDSGRSAGLAGRCPGSLTSARWGLGHRRRSRLSVGQAVAVAEHRLDLVACGALVGGAARPAQVQGRTPCSSTGWGRPHGRAGGARSRACRSRRRARCPPQNASSRVDRRCRPAIELVDHLQPLVVCGHDQRPRPCVRGGRGVSQPAHVARAAASSRP